MRNPEMGSVTSMTTAELKQKAEETRARAKKQAIAQGVLNELAKSPNPKEYIPEGASLMLDEEPVNISAVQAERDAERSAAQARKTEALAEEKLNLEKARQEAENKKAKAEKRREEIAADTIQKEKNYVKTSELDISEGLAQVTAETKEAALLEARKRALDAFEQGKREVA